MIDSARLEHALIAVARRYAPAFVPPGWAGAGDTLYSLPDLARRLAAEGALVIAAEVRADVMNAAVAQRDWANVYKDWADAYTNLYAHLSAALFPSFRNVSAFYVDQAQPPIAVIQGECTPLVAVLGGYIAPYASSRAGARPSDIELRGILDMLLDDLEATDLNREDYSRLRDDAMILVRRLLDLPVQHIAIVPPSHAILGTVEASAANDIHDMPTSMPETAPPSMPEFPPTLPESMPEVPSPPPTLPETPSAKPAAVDAPFPADAVPIFFRPSKRDANDMPPPPVPPLPGDIPR